MPAKVNPIPPGYHSVTPFLVVSAAARAIDFYSRAFNAKEVSRMSAPDGKVLHAELQIGDSRIMLADEMMGAKSPLALGGSPVTISLYVEDVDSVFHQAISAGATPDMPPADMFWGDRYGRLTDPFGHLWSLATHIEDLSQEEMAKRMEEVVCRMSAAAVSAA